MKNFGVCFVLFGIFFAMQSAHCTTDLRERVSHYATLSIGNSTGANETVPWSACVFHVKGVQWSPLEALVDGLAGDGMFITGGTDSNGTLHAVVLGTHDRGKNFCDSTISVLKGVFPRDLFERDTLEVEEVIVGDYTPGDAMTHRAARGCISLVRTCRCTSKCKCILGNSVANRSCWCSRPYWFTCNCPTCSCSAGYIPRGCTLGYIG